MSPTVWYTAQSAGIVAYLLLSSSVVLGLSMSARAAFRWPRFAVDGLHRTSSMLAIAFLALHIVTAVLDSFAPISLVDAVVDHCFPILEFLGERLESLEKRILENPTPDALRDIYRLKRELLTLRRSVWPMREVVHQLQGETNECFSETSRTYMRDVYDHVVQIIDVIEAYRETAMGLTETYMTVIGNRMNQIMKVLTIIGTIFIPLTFLAGVYGMNFKYIPELEQKWAHPAFWAVCIVLAGGMLAWFRKQKWL